MEALDWGALIIICIAGALSPGPSLLVIISITTRYGRLAGILGATGHGLAIFVYALTTALGVSWLSSSANQLFFYVQISGALISFMDGLIYADFCADFYAEFCKQNIPCFRKHIPPRANLALHLQMGF